MFGKNLSGPKGLPPGNISVNVPAVRSVAVGDLKVPVIAFSNEQLKEENQMVSKADTLTMMKEKNPKEFNKVKSAMLMRRPAVNEPMGQEGFMNMEEV